MPDLSVFTKLQTIPLRVMGERVNVTIDPGAYDQTWQDELNDIVARQDAHEDSPGELNEEFLALMSRLIKGWDLFEGDSPFPATVEGFRRMPIGLRTAVFNEVQEHVLSLRPKDRKRRLSAVT